MSPPMPLSSSEFILLVNKLLDETISPEEHRRLMDHLHGNPDAIKEYLFSIDVHASLKELEVQSEEETVAQGTRPDAALLPTGALHIGTSSRRFWKNWGIPAIAGAAVMLLVSLFFQPGANWNVVKNEGESIARNEPASPPTNTDSVPPGEVASQSSPVILTQAANAELFFEKTPEIGAKIALGREFVLSKGIMELTFDNGASAVLQAPAIFVVAGPTRIEMKMGRCSVHAPESAVGFEVVTPQGRVVDLGTRFSVVAKEVGVSDIQVIEGAVEYHPPAADSKAGTGSMLLEGEAIRIPDVSHDTEAIPFDRAEYQSRFPDRIVSYSAELGPGGKGVRDLTSVTVQRGGTIQTYPVEDLVSVELLHFSAYSKSNSTCSAGPNPRRADLLLADSIALTEGVTNFDRGPKPYQPANEFQNFRERNGLAVKFDRPVRNQPGPDIVLFELQSAAYPTGGDRFYVSPIEDQAGLKTFHVQQFDITMHSANALEISPVMTHLLAKPPHSLEELLASKVERSSLLHVPFYALAVGIDLSDLGYAANASAPGVFIEDADDDEFIAIDVVFIGGFP